jgi:hypothetical protein
MENRGLQIWDGDEIRIQERGVTRGGERESRTRNIDHFHIVAAAVSTSMLETAV